MADLNTPWDATDGGALRIYPAGESGHGVPPSHLAGAVHAADVLFEGGTLVLLMSGDVEHMVCETRAERQCVVGWFRERCERPAPDLAATSLRTLRLLDREATVGSCAARAGESSNLGHFTLRDG